MCARGSHVGIKVGQVLEEARRTAGSSWKTIKSVGTKDKGVYGKGTM
jgi:hypothetical protein